MTPDCTHLSNEELKRLLHKKNFEFSQGVEKGLPFDTLRTIRQTIRSIIEELEKRTKQPR